MKDTVNNGVAFLSHLNIDHGITFIPQQMTEPKTRTKGIGQSYETVEQQK